jgi:hypothetical protein
MNEDATLQTEEWQTDAFVGKNSDYYKEKWALPLSSMSINWAALFFPYEWLSYRRMYIEVGFIFLVQIVVMSFIFTMIPALRTISFVTNIIIGLTGNTIYYIKFQRMLKKSASLSAEDQSAYLEKRGGTSRTALIIVIVLELSISLLNNYLTITGS